MSRPEPLVNADRLLDDLQTLRSFGSTGPGVVRTMYSDVDLEARRWLVARMTDAGLDATIDGVGTVFGRSRNDGPAVVLGSHTDTQPEGGWLDGAMGVMHALEVARALAECPTTAHLAVDVASWADEEGTFSSFLGARSFVGSLVNDDYVATNADGVSVGAELERHGLADRPRTTLDPERQVAYFESHIEQGPRLEDAGLRIGVVAGIVGIRTVRVEFAGRQNHAGTTPMQRRADAAAALFRFGSTLNERMPGVAGADSVWTIGEVQVEPGAQSIVPGRAVALVQFRDTDAAVLDRMQSAIAAIASEIDEPGGVRVAAPVVETDVAPAPMDADLVATFEQVAERRVPGGWMTMPSAAGHDAQVLARHMPSAMLFIPSIDGLSHDFGEDSHHDDIVLGAQVLVDAVVAYSSATR